MIIHMLGGGPAQVSLIRRAKDLGYKVVVSDLNPQAPGLKEADYPSLASTFDEEAVLRDARKFHSDFLVTAGTDQPVLTAARVSAALNLPYFLTPSQALVVTNKKVMKQAFRGHGIPTMDFTFLKPGFHDSELEGLHFPLVIKPLDSQGQRGVLRVENCEEIRRNISIVLSFSRQEEILAEEYYPSIELTVSGWVEKGRAHIFSITDRVTVDNGPHLGVCVSHRYPSLCHGDWDELEVLTAKITAMIGLKNGPLYFQILSGDRGYRVNEIACRLGGAYEDEFLPWLCGVPLLDLMIEMTAGSDYNSDYLNHLSRIREGKYLSLQMFFSRPGRLCSREGMEKVVQLENILNGRFLLPAGTKIFSRENSTQRAGYFIACGQNPHDLNRLIRESYDLLHLKGQDGRNLIQFYERMLFPYEESY
ncbi:MAG: hypothetical protein B6241_05000 [Spirochaetaceae bacterium 4572_59]|nr:MAG: hypothetical protein B6241_05000 [Spirochaetaceae bacterium 4572_59]